MQKTLSRKLTSNRGLIRKGAAALLSGAKWFRSWRVVEDDFRRVPPILANSFPKSGTHLVFQIVEGIPNTINYGAFLASMTSSFRFRERSTMNATQFIRRIVPGEVVRGHLYFQPQYAAELAKKNAVHYFIYRDPRDVVVSEAHYLRAMNRWHRLAPYFRRVASINEAIMLSITGFKPPVPGIEYPNIAERFGRYEGWLGNDGCLAIRFEDLASENRPAVLRQMAEYYAARCSDPIGIDACVAAMTASIVPHKSHTFRSGKKAGWRNEFTGDHRRVFGELAGELLIRLGYEADHEWAARPPLATGSAPSQARV